MALRLKYVIVSNTTIYKKLGWLFIFLSILFLIVLVLDYRFKCFFNYNSVSDISALIAAICGFLASLAGLFFVVENLKFQGKTIEQQNVSIELQRKELQNQISEMKESNNYYKDQTITFKNQAIESTFFQLLENYRSHLMHLKFRNGNGYDGLNTFYYYLRNNTLSYYRIGFERKIENVSNIPEYPIKLLYQELENIEQICDNLTHLIEFIKVKLNDNVFFHKTLFNSLSKAEKYVLPMYIINERNNLIELFKSFQFNYLQFFEGSGNAYFHKVSLSYFPNISVIHSFNWYNFIDGQDIITREFDNSIGRFRLEILENFCECKLKLKSLKIEYNLVNKDYAFQEAHNIALKDKHTLLISNLLIDAIYFFASNFDSAKKNQGFSFQFLMILTISVDKEIFEYKQRFEFSAINFNEESAKLRIEKA